MVDAKIKTNTKIIKEIKYAASVDRWIRKHYSDRVKLSELFEKLSHNHLRLANFFKYFPVRIVIDGKELLPDGCKGYHNGCDCAECRLKEEAQKIVKEV
ncbi:hypothetical protein DRO97_02385 [Archaeoglobales archaeon]|nr:MAG: hypothetical protein DRO97_02385 [Archaeoglobales archaeon]